MSCRVIGMAVEQAVMAELVGRIRGQGIEVTAALIETDANLPCRTFYLDCGFVRSGDGWVLPRQVDVALPAFIRLGDAA